MNVNGDYLRDRGCELVESNNQDFISAMRFHAILTIKKAGKCSVDELRKIAIDLGLKPAHPNAWGAIFRSKDFKATGIKKSGFQSNHSRRIIEWELA